MRSAKIAGWPWLHLLYLAWMAGTCAVLWLAPSAPVLQDYPDWVYQGALFARTLAHHPIPGYQLKAYPVPNTLTTVGLGLLIPVLGWKAAAKLWLTVVLAALTLSGWRLARMLRLSASLALLVVQTAVFLGANLWQGNVNFLLGEAMLLCLLACLMADTPSTSRLTVMLLLLFFAHLLPCAAGMLLVLTFAIERRRWNLLLALLPVLALIAWYGIARESPENVPASSSLSHLLPALVVTCATLAWFFRLRREEAFPHLEGRALLAILLAGVGAIFLLRPLRNVAGPLVRLKLITFSGVFGVANITGTDASYSPVILGRSLFVLLSGVSILIALGCVGLLLAGLFERARRRKLRFLDLTVILLAELFLLLPFNALGVDGIDDRVLHLAVLLSLPLLATVRHRRTLAMLVVAAVLIDASNLYQLSIAQRPGSERISGIRREDAVPGTFKTFVWEREGYYDHLERGAWDLRIFPSALYLEHSR